MALDLSSPFKRHKSHGKTRTSSLTHGLDLSLWVGEPVLSALDVWVGVAGFLPLHLLRGSLLWGFPDMLLFLL